MVKIDKSCIIVYCRFYIMRLKDRELKFRTITHHASVTQCLGAIGGGTWYLGVAKSTVVDDVNEGGGIMKQSVVKSLCGHFYVPPEVNEVRVFKIEGSKFLKLHRGTWHAGPLFLDEMMDFYNLELNNTNVSTSHNFTSIKQSLLFFWILHIRCSLKSSSLLASESSPGR